MSEPVHRMKVSREGMILIKSFEGFRPRAVRDEAGRWTVGYGHTLSAREGAAVTEAEAELLLQYDLLPVVQILNERFGEAVNQHQFDALASFALSVGLEQFLASDVANRLSSGDVGEAADALFGWPEAVAPEDALRRRAAERALFVADPGRAVTLADLLAAPLPPPAPGTDASPARFSAESRAAAVASLLGEAAGEAEAPSEVKSEPAAVETPAFATPVETLATPESAPEETVADEAPSEAEADVEPEPPAVIVEAPPVQAPASLPVQVAAAVQFYSPYGAIPTSHLPGFPVGRLEPVAPPSVVAEPEEPVETAPEVEAQDNLTPQIEEPPTSSIVEPEVPLIVETTPEPEVAPEPPTPEPTAPEPTAPVVETPAFALTAPSEDERPVERPVWAEQRRDAPVVPQEPLFADEPLTTPVLRHEETETPRRFDWSSTGAFLIMGGTGLVACAASAAAFRRTFTDNGALGDYTLIGWVLAVIGGVCVAVSAWSLYRAFARKSQAESETD